MELSGIERESDYRWVIRPVGPMRVPAVLYADESLIRDMDETVREQICNVAALPGIVGAAYAMPDAHWGYGFPIGGVAAFDADQAGIVSAGGVGFDISCGVRALLTNLDRDEIVAVQQRLADELARAIPAGVGSTGRIHLAESEMDAMLLGGARWAGQRGWGRPEDLEHIEERGCIAGAAPAAISTRARKRQRDEMADLRDNQCLRICFDIPDAAAPLDVVADISRRTIDVGMTLRAPEDRKSSKARVNWLLRQIKTDKTDDLHVRLQWPGRSEPTQFSVEQLLQDVSVVDVDKEHLQVVSFHLFLSRRLGARFTQQTNFVAELEDTVSEFYAEVGAHLSEWKRSAPKIKREKQEPEDVSVEAVAEDAESVSRED